MANNVKYAQNLIGDWSKDIYEPKKQVLQDIYQTNWNKIANDYNTLRDTLERNYNNARLNYTNTLNDIQNASFNRMNNATIDLANRGLSSSGITNLVNQADTQTKGEQVNEALNSLLKTQGKGEEGLYEGLNTLGQSQTSLASGLLGDIGGLTDADAANMRQYAGLVGSISESAASRAASRAISNTESNSEEEFERRSRIAQVLESEDFDDDYKISLLTRYLDVPLEQAKSAVSAYNYDKVSNSINETQTTLNNYIDKHNLNSRIYTPEAQNIINNANVSNLYLSNLIRNDKRGISPSKLEDQILLDSYYNGMTGNAFAKNRAKALTNNLANLQKDLSKYTYGDIYNILYGGK